MPPRPPCEVEASADPASYGLARQPLLATEPRLGGVRLLLLTHVLPHVLTLLLLLLHLQALPVRSERGDGNLNVMERLHAHVCVAVSVIF